MQTFGQQGRQGPAVRFRQNVRQDGVVRKATSYLNYWWSVSYTEGDIVSSLEASTLALSVIEVLRYLTI